MIFTDKEIYTACKKIAPAFGFDPKLIFAINQQECEHRVVDADGKFRFHPDLFRADKCRLEQRFYDKYVERQNEFATTTEGLLALSWGIMQMMGLSLFECGYFQWWFDQQGESQKEYFKESMNEVAVMKALNWYVVNLEAMITWGCRHLDKKRKLAGGNIERALDLWNGDLSGGYRKEVLDRIPLIKF